MQEAYPVSKETIHKYAHDIFSPIRRGECVTTIWVPMAGRRRHTNFIINNLELFKKELPEFEKYILTYVDPLDLTEESKSGYIRLIGKSLIESVKLKTTLKKSIKLDVYIRNFDDELIGYSRLLDILKELLVVVSKSSFEIVLFLGEFDEIDYVSPAFFGNLKSLWNKLYPHLHFVFLIRGRVTRSENIKLWGEELSEIVFQNIVYIPLLEDVDVKYMFERLSQEFDSKLSEMEVSLVKSMCGGHPYMLKVAVKTLAIHGDGLNQLGIEKMLEENQELVSIATRVYRRQAEKDRDILEKISRGDGKRSIEEGEPLEFLERMGVVTRNSKGGFKLFSTLFKKAIIKYQNEHTERLSKELKIDEISKRVFLDNKSIEGEFSRQELSVIKLFLLSDGGFSSREQVGKALWGPSIDKKFSNWAIDQVISKLRKKLKDLGTNTEIVTLRGEGYRFL